MLSRNVEVSVDACMIDKSMSQGQIRPLFLPWVEVRMDSIKSNHPDELIAVLLKAIVT